MILFPFQFIWKFLIFPTSVIIDQHHNTISKRHRTTPTQIRTPKILIWTPTPTSHTFSNRSPKSQILHNFLSTPSSNVKQQQPRIPSIELTGKNCIFFHGSSSHEDASYFSSRGLDTRAFINGTTRKIWNIHRTEGNRLFCCERAKRYGKWRVYFHC